MGRDQRLLCVYLLLVVLMVEVRKVEVRKEAEQLSATLRASHYVFQLFLICSVGPGPRVRSPSHSPGFSIVFAIRTHDIKY